MNAMVVRFGIFKQINFSVRSQICICWNRSKYASQSTTVTAISNARDAICTFVCRLPENGKRKTNGKLHKKEANKKYELHEIFLIGDHLFSLSNFIFGACACVCVSICACVKPKFLLNSFLQSETLRST